MKTWYVVETDDRSISWSDKTESGESFRSMAAATRRARELASASPGKEIHVCEAVAVVVCDVSSPRIEKP